jgi:hypothetical protein
MVRGVSVEAGLDPHSKGAFLLMRSADSICPVSSKPLGRFYRDGALVVVRRLLALDDVPDDLPVSVADAISDRLRQLSAESDIPIAVMVRRGIGLYLDAVSHGPAPGLAPCTARPESNFTDAATTSSVPAASGP